MAGRLPSVPILNAQNPAYAVQQLVTYLNSLRGALEERESAIEALGYNPSSPLWGGRDLPSYALPVGIVTGAVGFGLYDSIALVWDFDPDPAIEGWDIECDGVFIDRAKINCYLHKPIGDLADHDYIIWAVRVGDYARGPSSSETVTVHAETDEAIIRENFALAVTAWQTAAMRRTSVTATFNSGRNTTFSTTSGTNVALTGGTIDTEVPSGTAGVTDFFVFGSADEIVLTNNTGAALHIEGIISIIRVSTGVPQCTSNIEATIGAGASVAWPWANIITPGSPEGTDTYRLEARVNPGGGNATMTINGYAIRAMLFKR